MLFQNIDIHISYTEGKSHSEDFVWNILSKAFQRSLLFGQLPKQGRVWLYVAKKGCSLGASQDRPCTYAIKVKPPIRKRVRHLSRKSFLGMQYDALEKN